MKKTISLLGLFFCLTQVTATPPTDVLFVTLGGYSTCNNTGPTGIGMYRPFQAFLSKVKEQNAKTNIHYIVTCLPDVKPPKGQGQFISSQNPEKTQYGDTYRIRDEIEAIAKQSNDMQVYITGHSYGGWMSMFLTTNLSPTVKIKGLFTLDPISTKCGPSQVVLGGKACKQAPVEFDNKGLLARVGYWENFYQRQDAWLQSSSIPEAINHLMKYRGPHNSVDRDQAVWNMISDAILGKLLK